MQLALEKKPQFRRFLSKRALRGFIADIIWAEYSDKFFAFGFERVGSSQVRGLHRAGMLCVIRFFFNLVSDISSCLAGACSNSKSESVVSIFLQSSWWKLVTGTSTEV